MRSPRAALLVTALLSISWALPALAGGRGQSVEVERVTFPVSLSDGNTYDLVGFVYHKGPKPRGKQIQIALHGATYDHRYWDAPTVNGEAYSYAREMASRGHVVLALDQLGAGESDKPDGDFFGLEEAASALHQVAERLREQHNPVRSRRFDEIVYVGHSNGSVTSIYAQATYGDADAVVVTGWIHGFRGLPVDPTNPALGDALATPYVSLPGFLRPILFYNAASSDPDVIATDIETLSVAIPRRQFLDLLGVHADITFGGPGHRTTLTRAQQVTVPVLVQAGDRDDLIAPGSIVSQEPTEASFFSSSPSVTVQVLSDMGHAFNTHLTREAGWDGIEAWIAETLETR